jgi:mRNA interferase RelE/StbE
MYQVLYEKRVLKDLDKIPSQDAERILAVFETLSSDPYPQGSKKLSGKLHLYRIRQGNYRIVYTVAHQEKEIRIILVRHRKEAYRDL